VRDPAILFIGPWSGIALAAVTLGCGAAAWTVMVSGYCGRVLHAVERILFGAMAVVLILAPFGTIGKFVSVGVFAILTVWSLRATLFGGARSIPVDK
jgi:hypothetical protein